MSSFQNKLRVREYLARAVEAILDLDRLLHKVNDAIPGVASKLLLVAHEALETERAIQGAVQEEEVGGVVAQVAVEVVGLIPGLERSDRLVRAFEVGEAVENGLEKGLLARLVDVALLHEGLAPQLVDRGDAEVVPRAMCPMLDDVLVQPLEPRDVSAPA